MATKKKMLQAAAGNATGGAGGLNVEDVFSTYLYEGNGSSQIIQNGINLGAGLTGTSVEFDGSGDVLNVAASSDFQLNNDLTIEGYVFFDPSAQVQLYPAVVNVGLEYGNGKSVV